MAWRGSHSQSEPSTVVMAEMFLLSRLTSYTVFGSLGDTDQSQAHLSTKSQWVEEAISRNIFAGFRAQWMINSQKSAVTTSIAVQKQKDMEVGRRKICLLKPPNP